MNNPGLSVGFKFLSKWFKCLEVEVLEIQEDQNILNVKITRSPEHWHEEQWNLAHTRAGFAQGDYKALEYDNK
ncbi:hypothetical protein [Siphonobacter sp. SORGH_AS_1065]|uniref:hypothetical protein n=1 Tax=Siphonobacter sp. SORGH_AS_1065 TaxID=3041795 RepID=UPI0027842962|nr:hypothetical protein [Siphonobacter sp. SORGH_AS_1065]MDQ1085670.1 hypothetical protein [Siphonobacter sp. SORGH_AS_1065]